MSLEAVLKRSLGYAAIRSVPCARGHGDTASGSALEVTGDAGNKARKGFCHHDRIYHNSNLY